MTRRALQGQVPVGLVAVADNGGQVTAAASLNWRETR